jgi:hypothetical protein
MKPSIPFVFVLALLPFDAVPAAEGIAGPGPLHDRLPVEISAERERLVRQAAEMDRDGDGYITSEERRAWREAKRAARADQGHKVRVEDFVTRRLARLEAIDANKDGRIDAEEWRGFHAGKGHGRFRGEGKARGKGFRHD